MPLVLDTPGAANKGRSGATHHASPESDTIEIALLNNLGDGGLEMGERQIVELLSEAAGPRLVRLRFFSLPRIERGPRARAHLAIHYADFADLMRSRVDGLIVTGCEPRANLLPDEAFWHGLTEVVDWAEHNTRSTIWSCLAAHAAVLHLDGIHRQPLDQKCSGLFTVDRALDHPLISGLRRPLLVPHSRWNDLAEDELVAAGYQVVTHSSRVGVDLFVKQWRSLFVYLQGHPEYDPDALQREYRRDVARYIDGMSTTYPHIPETYYTDDQERAMAAFEIRARQGRDPDLMASFPVRSNADRRPARRSFARGLFGNWLRLLEQPVVGRGA